MIVASVLGSGVATDRCDRRLWAGNVTPGPELDLAVQDGLHVRGWLRTQLWNFRLRHQRSRVSPPGIAAALGGCTRPMLLFDDGVLASS